MLETEQNSQVIIIGAGLSGLLLAYRFKKIGVPFKILEARNRIGGRIHTVTGANGTPVEMGATWFHHEHHHLLHLLKELDIPFYEQYMDGKAHFQSAPGMPTESFLMPEQVPSYRISGGSRQLTEKLSELFDAGDVVLDEPVKSIEFEEDRVVVSGRKTYQGRAVILALPPKLWEESISFQPELPASIRDTARKTQTWMEESVKIAVAYEKPFWREKKMSGTLFSNVGPMTELYDHCNRDVSKYALCGFLHPNFKSLDQSERESRVIKQLSEVFGEEANSYLDYNELDWGKEQFTSGLNRYPLFPHQNNGDLVYQRSLFQRRLFFAGTETSSHHGGYMEGAVYVSSQVFAHFLRL